MVRTRTGWLVALVALGLGAGACKKKEENKAAQPGTSTTQTDGTGTVAPTGGPVAAATAVGSDDLSLLPADSEMVMGLNFAQLQQSALWKQYSPLFMGKISSGLADFKTACGFDPMEAITSV
jgi:hypothetical protein